jgi:hypothetical protein
LSSRYYYLYAEDAERGGRWDGPINMCVAEREFKIAGVNDCLARGFQRAGFQEYDTGEQASWMVQLTDEPADSGAAATGQTNPMRRTARSRYSQRSARFLRRGDDEEAVRRRRGRVPHQHEPHRPRPDARAGGAHSCASRTAVGRPIGILADLQGPKLRVGKFANGAGRN